MDIMSVLVSAAAIVGNAAVTEGAKVAVREAWDGALGAIKGKLGSGHAVPALIERLPSAVANPVETTELRDSLASLRVDWSDPTLVAAVERLALALRNEQPATNTVNATNFKGANVVHGDIHFNER